MDQEEYDSELILTYVPESEFLSYEEAINLAAEREKEFSFELESYIARVQDLWNKEYNLSK